MLKLLCDVIEERWWTSGSCVLGIGCHQTQRKTD